MQPLLKQYLDGTLESSGGMQIGQVNLDNKLKVPVWAGFLTPDGALYPAVGALAGKPGSGPGPISWYWLVWSLDGSLAAAFKGVSSGPLDISIGATDLSSPGDIGPVPAPSAEIPIPNDSPSVLVGTAAGKDSEGRPTYLTRRRRPNSSKRR